MKMPVVETHLKIFNSCFLYIQQVIARNNFTQFQTWETGDLDSPDSERKLVYEFTAKNNVFFVNSHYYFYIAILFLCYVFPFGSKNFVFPLLSCIILDFELERIFKKSFKDFSKHIVSDGQMELILKHKCTFI